MHACMHACMCVCMCVCVYVIMSRRLEALKPEGVGQMDVGDIGTLIEKFCTLAISRNGTSPPLHLLGKPLVGATVLVWDSIPAVYLYVLQSV